MNLELYKIDNHEEAIKVHNMLALQDKIEKEILSYETKIKELKSTNEQSKQLLLEAMEKYDIKSLETDNFKITRILPSTRTTIDSKKLKEQEPDIYNKYLKVSEVKTYLKITEKKGD